MEAAVPFAPQIKQGSSQSGSPNVGCFSIYYKDGEREAADEKRTMGAQRQGFTETALVPRVHTRAALGMQTRREEDGYFLVTEGGAYSSGRKEASNVFWERNEQSLSLWSTSEWRHLEVILLSRYG